MIDVRDSMNAAAVLDEQTYCTIYEQMEKPHVTQSWAWGEAKKATEKLDVIRLVFHRGNDPIGLCQILRKKYLGVPVVSRINRGPSFRPGLSDAEKLGVISKLRSRFRYMLGGVLLIAPGMCYDRSHIDALRSLGFWRRRMAGGHSAIIDVHADIDQIRKGLHSKWRNQLKLGEKSGLLLSISSSIESAELLINRHEDHMRQKGFGGPSGGFLRSLHRASPRDFVVLVASTSAGPVGGVIIIKHGLNSEYLVGWFGEEGRKLAAGNFLLWNATIEMKRRGCRWLDLGGIPTSERFGHFKMGMGGDAYDLVGEWLCFW
jgi:hypothetical protein